MKNEIVLSIRLIGFGCSPRAKKYSIIHVYHPTFPLKYAEEENPIDNDKRRGGEGRGTIQIMRDTKIK